MLVILSVSISTSQDIWQPIRCVVQIDHSLAFFLRIIIRLLMLLMVKFRELVFFAHHLSHGGGHGLRRWWPILNGFLDHTAAFARRDRYRHAVLCFLCLANVPHNQASLVQILTRDDV